MQKEWINTHAAQWLGSKTSLYAVDSEAVIDILGDRIAEMMLNITDLWGRVFHEENISVSKGINSMPIELAHLIDGLYIINIHSRFSTQRTKLIINS